MPKRIGKILLHAGSNPHDGVNLRRWFVFYLMYLVALAAMVWGSLRYAGADGWESRIWLVGLYMFYLSLCCTFFPAPTAWLVLLIASPMVALVEPGEIAAYVGPGNPRWFPVITAFVTVTAVALIGAAASTMANLNEYHVVTFLLRFGKVHRMRSSKIYLAAIKFFAVSPFWLILAVNVVPVPVDVVRFLAISHRYRRVSFAVATFLGRCVRYGLLASAATCLKIGWVGILAIQASLLGLILLRYLPRLFEHCRGGQWKTENSELKVETGK